MTSEREYWLVWSTAENAFRFNGSGIAGDFAKQEFSADQRGFLVDQGVWAKNGVGAVADDFRGALLNQLSVRFLAEVEAGCDSPKGRVHCDDQAQSRFLAALRLMEELAARDLPHGPIKWTMWDRSQITHDMADLKDMGLAMGKGFQDKMAVRQAKEAQIRDPDATVADLMAIDIAEGWPE